MNKLRLLLLLSLASLVTMASADAQDIAYGFKAGLNFNSIIADSEMDANGMDLESFDSKTGFHVGATFSWKATDLMGLRGEFLFSQKGYKKRYNGPSYYSFTADNGTQVNSENGNRNIFVSNANSYIEIPIMGYAKLTKWLEVHLGATVGVLISSTAVGDFEYSGTTSNGSPIDLAYDLDYRYGADDPGEFDEAAEPITVTIGNNPFTLPNSAGAYFEYDTDEGRFHNLLDLGLIGGLSFYLNRGLYVAVRGSYGLTDITNDDADYSFLEKEADDSFKTTNDSDKNFSIQASVGFSF